jgi:hypothetical protein
MPAPPIRFISLSLACAALACALPAGARAAFAADAPDSAHASHDMSAMGHDMSAMGHDMSGMEMGGVHGMPALYGSYAVSREASGTSWQPDLTPHRGMHLMPGSWSVMLHGFFEATANHQSGPRGDQAFYSTNMLMAVASHALGPGRLGLRAMADLEPATVPNYGYPLLLQTGETRQGDASLFFTTSPPVPLIDHQHPHDAVMELAATYSVSGEHSSAFVYGGLPGEPALGPPVYMHRFSASGNPETPIGHHWMDSTHITHGVVTLGATSSVFKLDGSAFRGREPDQSRWNIEAPKLDSWSVRASMNPVPALALQVSTGHLVSPEALHPDIDQKRTTASASWQHSTARTEWQTTLAWGRTRDTLPDSVVASGAPASSAHSLDAWLLESTLEHNIHTWFGRVETVQKDDLAREGDPLFGEVFRVTKFGLGYRIRVLRATHVDITLGAYGTASFTPEPLRAEYGGTPISGELFARAALR